MDISCYNIPRLYLNTAYWVSRVPCCLSAKIRRKIDGVENCAPNQQCSKRARKLWGWNLSGSRNEVWKLYHSNSVSDSLFDQGDGCRTAMGMGRLTATPKVSKNQLRPGFLGSVERLLAFLRTKRHPIYTPPDHQTSKVRRNVPGHYDRSQGL